MSFDVPSTPNPRAELEAKVTALLLGELSPGEAAHMRELIAKDDDLRELQEQLSVTLDLLRETAATPVGKTPAQPAPLKLSPARREKLLAHFKTVAPKEFARPFKWKMSRLLEVAAVAAGITLLAYSLLPRLAGSSKVAMRSAVRQEQFFDATKETQGGNGQRAPGFTSTPPGESNAKPTSSRELRDRRKAEENRKTAAVQQRIVLPQSDDWQLAGNNHDQNGKYAATNGPVGFTFQDALTQVPTVAPAATLNGWQAPSSVDVGGGAVTISNVANSGVINNQGEAQVQFFTENGNNNAQANNLGVNDIHGLNKAALPSTQSAASAAEAIRVGGDFANAGVNDRPVNAGVPRTETGANGVVTVPGTLAGEAANKTGEKKSKASTANDLAWGGRSIGGEEEKLRREGKISGARVKMAPKVTAEPAGNSFNRNGATSLAGSSPALAGTDSYASAKDTEKTGLAGVAQLLPGTANANVSAGVPPSATAAASPDTNEHYSINAVGYINLTLPGNSAGVTATLVPSSSQILNNPAPAAPPQLSTDRSLDDKSPGATTVVPGAPAPTYDWANRQHKTPAITDNGIKQAVDGDQPLPQPARPALVPQPEVLTRVNAFTTFSLNVSDVAFKLAQASLQNGQMPEAGSMRSEEFINAFDYRDPEPALGAPVGFAWERAADPFAHHRDFLRFSIKTAAQGRQAGRPLNLVLLLDKSGSMERADRVDIIAQALNALASQLQPGDMLSVVVFARTARLFVDGVPGSKAGEVAKDLRRLPPEGGTNLEEAMRLAYATALRHYLANGENRVVLLTDGAANLGNVDPEVLRQKAEMNRKQGIALDCFGVGWDGYNDQLLETLSRAGNGRYGFVNTPQEAATEFAGKLAGALRVAAADVKVQVEFNPARVTSYRQIGYCKDQLAKQDFRDNSVKAAQIGAAEAGNALYTVEINPAGEGPLGTVRVRFRVPGTETYEEHEWTLPYTGSAAALEKASPAMRLTAVAASFSEWLAASPTAGEVTTDRLLQYLRGVPQVYGADDRPARLEWMIRQAKSISGK